jgi:saccharopine dehydrogenase-like NADP-dependent oxidoreductase
MARIHWCGTGLSAIPGLRDLIAGYGEVTVWNRTPEKAQAAVGDLTGDIRAFTPGALSDALAPGDLVVSMLATDWHQRIAELCLAKGGHFVSSSYTTDAMRGLDGPARSAGLAVVNECGLDPGIDHAMAHGLVADYRASPAYDPAQPVAFTSYCGGVPKHPNPFRYKFSWSPLGVLRALKSPARSIANGVEVNSARPWEALSRYTAPLPQAEDFEVYPNRDSIPFMGEYGFDPAWPVDTFVRGTLRLDGWAAAWAGIFDQIETLSPEALTDLSARLWDENAYGPGEPDRVVLCVSLRVGPADAPVWHKTWAMDAWGDARGSAMARLVSHPVALSARMILDGRIGPGVSTVPSDPALVAAWMQMVRALAQHLDLVDHLA